MAYKIFYTSSAAEDFENCLNYLIYHVGDNGNLQAARNFLADFEHTISLIKDFPFGFAICEDLSIKDERKVHFKHMNYKIFYHVENDFIIIDALCHDLQDYRYKFNSLSS